MRKKIHKSRLYRFKKEILTFTLLTCINTASAFHPKDPCAMHINDPVISYSKNERSDESSIELTRYAIASSSDKFPVFTATKRSVAARNGTAKVTKLIDKNHKNDVYYELYIDQKWYRVCKDYTDIYIIFPDKTRKKISGDTIKDHYKRFPVKYKILGGETRWDPNAIMVLEELRFIDP